MASEPAKIIQLNPAKGPNGGVPFPVWDACEEALGYGPKTRSERALWGKMCHSLVEAGADREKILAVAEWYRRHWTQVDLTITAIEKWYSHFLAMKDKKGRKKEVCRFCEVGGGLHAVDCRRDQ